VGDWRECVGGSWRVCVCVRELCVKRHDDLLDLSVTGIFDFSCLPRNSKDFSMESDLNVTFDNPIFSLSICGLDFILPIKKNNWFNRNSILLKKLILEMC